VVKIQIFNFEVSGTYNSHEDLGDLK